MQSHCAQGVSKAPARSDCFSVSLLSLPLPSYSQPCQTQALSLRQENLERDHLMQLLFQNSLTCAKCQREPCCATAPARLGKIATVQCRTPWMVSQLHACPICSSQLILICFSLCACRGTTKTAASLRVPWDGSVPALSPIQPPPEKEEQDPCPVLPSLPSSGNMPSLYVELWNNKTIPPVRQPTLKPWVRCLQNTAKHMNATSQPILLYELAQLAKELSQNYWSLCSILFLCC